jgi:phage host-nuclease inhibitor protein Gam
MIQLEAAFALITKGNTHDEIYGQDNHRNTAWSCIDSDHDIHKEKQMTNFIDEMLLELEEKFRLEKVDFDKQNANRALGFVAKLEEQMADVNKLAGDEIALIENYRKNELERLDKKRSWLLFNLENFARQQMEQTGEKTCRLPKGSLSLRKGRDRIEIQDMTLFLKVAAKYGFLRTTPAKDEPDLKAVCAHYTRTGEIVSGTKVIPATTNFSYQLSTNGGSTDDTK